MTGNRSEQIELLPHVPLLRVKGRQPHWVIGWKVLNPLIDLNTGELKFYPAFSASNSAVTYGVKAEAQCNYAFHGAPFHGCLCGFNAYHERAVAMRNMNFDPHLNGRCRQSLSLARVGLYGRVHEGSMSKTDMSWGYRAEKCQVADIFVPAVCRMCQRPAVQFALKVCMHYSHGRYGGSERFFQPRCERCIDIHMTPVSVVRQHVERAGVGFHWLDE